jgi:ribose/xylose/arabinose/galactoside ABC-type transport system permease subunit
MNDQKNRTNLSLWYKNSSTASTLTILLILILMSTALAIAAPAFLKTSNLLSTARNFSAIAVAGIGVSIVILTGNIDISIGSVYGLAGVTVAMLMNAGWSALPAVFMGMAVGALCGLANGALVVYLRLPSYIATLGMMQIVRGICYILTRGYPVSGMADSFKWIGQGQLLGIPVRRSNANFRRKYKGAENPRLCAGRRMCGFCRYHQRIQGRRSSADSRQRL